MDIFGKPWVEIDEDLADDLLTCKRIASIIDYQNEQPEGEPTEEAVVRR